MSLKQLVGQKILTDVIRDQREEDKWKILVLDRLSTRILSSCCKMTDIMQERITLIEDLTKARQPMTNMEAIYFITPCDESITKLINDFKTRNTYTGVHLYFTDTVPDYHMDELKSSRVIKFIRTFKEINIAFLPYESQVYMLDNEKSFKRIYNSSDPAARVETLERYAEQLATLCSLLGEYPSIRHQSWSENAVELANILQAKLNGFKADNPKMGEGAFKDQTQLIIIDRSFDPVSPLVHELTYQAMAQDLLDIDNDVMRYETTNERGQTTQKEVILDENDALWNEFRHNHIADCMRTIPERFKNFAKEKRHKTEENASIKDLSKMMQAMPQYQKEIQAYLNHMHIVEACQKQYSKNVEKLCKVEQDLATGETSERERLKEPMKNIIPILLDSNVDPLDKIRIILLYIYNKGGITEENLSKLVSHAQIMEKDECIIRNMAKLNVPITMDSGRKKPPTINRKDRSASVKYQLSRFVPSIKDVMEYAIDGKLDDRVFQFLAGTRPMVSTGGVRSARYHWHKKDGDKLEAKSGPRIIFFVIGGLTCSEIRSAYEVSRDYVPQRSGGRGNNQTREKWEVLVGSTHLVRPRDFLNMTGDLTRVTEVSFNDYGD